MNTTAAPNLTPEQAQALAGNLREKWSEPVEIDGGFTVRAKIEVDTYSSDDGFGQFDDSDNGRPEGFDGGARKIRARRGMIWWQPPVDLKNDPENLAKLEKRVRAYFLEEWYYVRVIVKVTGPKCPHCGERKSEERSLWGIESDAGEYFAEALTDLVWEARREIEGEL